MRLRIRHAWISVILLVCVSVGGVTAPAEARHRQFLETLGGFIAPMTPQQEVIVGSQLDRVVRERYPATTREGLQAYVSRVGKRIAVETNTSYPFTYTVLADTRTANAFSGPGGFIYITTGMLNILENESQLAAVLAHETAHVTSRHVVKQLQERRATDLALVLIGRITDVDLNNRLTRIGEFLLFQRFSREDEFEADRVGTRLMTQAGYNPQGMVQLLEKLNAMESRGVVISFLQSHPTSEERAAMAEAYIERNHLQKPGQILDTAEFHRMIR